MPRREDLKSVLVIGSGPIVIGQGRLPLNDREPEGGDDGGYH
jgi:hypothetical protein